ncbi:MAG: Txe/YoeB family addiction module toxin [Eggerthellaceae bacterium]|nr:Txe/YoeB family addiction module toxin [Eggerthellaceae bacterium]
MYKVVFTKHAAKDAKKLKSAGLDAKAKILLDVVREDPFQSPPTYKTLVGNLSGLYSRRINLQHRFVYQVIAEPTTEEGTRFDGIVKVVSMWSHYEDLR